MKINPLVRRRPEIFLILALAILGLIYLLHIALIRYRLHDWYKSNIDKAQAGLRVYYYPNREWDGAFVKTEIVRRFTYPDFGKRLNSSIRAVGVFSPPKAGHYKFFLKSDDGSWLYIDDKLVIDNGGVHPSAEKAKTIYLQRRRHLIVIDYFQGFHKADLVFNWSKTGETKKSSNLDIYFNPVTSRFQWGRDIRQFRKIDRLPNHIYVFALLVLFFVWFILRFGHYLYLIQNVSWLIVLISGIVVYKGVLSSTGPAFTINDIESLVFPKYYFIRDSFIRGEIPLWDPYTMLGQPGIVSLGLSMMYPFLLAFLSMGFLGPLLPRQLELLVVGHLIFSGITIYWGARKLGLGRLGACAAGIVFQMAIANKDLIRSVPMAFGLPWVPLVISYGIVILRSNLSILSRKNFLTFLITVTSLALLISTTYPNLIIYAFITLGLSAGFYIVMRVKEKNWFGIVDIIRKYFCICVFAIAFSAVIILPGYFTLKDSIRFNSLLLIKLWPLHRPIIWTMIFPQFANTVSPPFAYTGIIPVLLSIYFCILRNEKGKNDRFLFVLIGIFWFYFSVQDSYLERTLTSLPILKSMRIPAIALVMYAFAVALLTGMGLEKLSVSRSSKIRLNINWLFPVFIIFMLISSMRSFTDLVHHGFHLNSMIPLFAGFIFILYLTFRNLTGLTMLYNIIPFIILLEIYVSSPPFIGKSNVDRFVPYKGKLDRFIAEFPEAFASRDLYRIERFSQYTMVDYYFRRFNVYGFYNQGMQSYRYYYLWNKEMYNSMIFGEYEKTAISLYSKIYDLAGVRYFYLPEHEYLFIDYEKSGQGEWIEAELWDRITAYGMRTYNVPDPKQRRILEATIILNGKDKVHIDIPDTAGWHRFQFKPTTLHKFKIIADRVTSFKIGEGTQGVVISEIEFLNKNGYKIKLPIKSITTSSTMVGSNPDRLVDNKIDTAWESGCDVYASKVIPNENFERIGKGCYINKDVLPRAFIVHDYEYVKTKKELLEKLHKEDFKPDKIVLLEEKPDINIQQGPYRDNVVINKYRLNEVEILTENDKPGFLILTDVYSSGWQVFVDGKKDKLLAADGVFRGVFIDNGRHKVHFRYIPPFLKTGLAISILTVFILAIITIRVYR